MIIEYFRPQSLEETLLLLSRPYPVTVPLGGGVKLSRRIDEQIAVVDLQRLGLNNWCHGYSTTVIRKWKYPTSSQRRNPS
jgi:CO/xanthine dehydrogenase FAD-binding subunit